MEKVSILVFMCLRTILNPTSRPSPRKVMVLCDFLTYSAIELLLTYLLTYLPLVGKFWLRPCLSLSDARIVYIGCDICRYPLGKSNAFIGYVQTP